MDDLSRDDSFREDEAAPGDAAQAPAAEAAPARARRTQPKRVTQATATESVQETPALPVHTPLPRRRRLRPLLFALLPVALVAGGYFYVTGGAVMSTENAYVQADIVRVSTDVSGMVAAIDVKDNQHVKAGDVLFRLDDTQFRLAVERADAQIGLVRNDLEALRASYRMMQAQIAQAEQDITFFDTAFKRQQQLTSRNYASQATYDTAEHDLQGARQKLQQLKDQAAGIIANLNGNPDARIEDHPRYRDAVAAHDEAVRQLDHTTVRAPFAGIVTNVPSMQKGQYLEAGTAAFSLVSSDHVWVSANPKETELTYVKPGQGATITVDTYPGETWTGTVESISPASAASFSLLPAENSSGNWVKVVQRIPMRVLVETSADKPQLRVGMSVIVDVDTGHPRGLPKF